MTRGSGLLDRASRALAAARAGSEERRPAFVEGVLLGAMVGAAIAGSTLWSRVRGRGQLDGSSPAADAAEPDGEDLRDPTGA